ncbi:MAG: hypothetical protein ACYCOU_03305 [Sulfobacillus sp.]
MSDFLDKLDELKELYLKEIRNYDRIIQQFSDHPRFTEIIEGKSPTPMNKVSKQSKQSKQSQQSQQTTLLDIYVSPAERSRKISIKKKAWSPHTCDARQFGQTLGSSAIAPVRNEVAKANIEQISDNAIKGLELDQETNMKLRLKPKLRNSQNSDVSSQNQDASLAVIRLDLAPANAQEAAIPVGKYAPQRREVPEISEVTIQHAAPLNGMPKFPVGSVSETTRTFPSYQVISGDNTYCYCPRTNGFIQPTGGTAIPEIREIELFWIWFEGKEYLADDLGGIYREVFPSYAHRIGCVDGDNIVIG